MYTSHSTHRETTFKSSTYNGISRPFQHHGGVRNHQIPRHFSHRRSPTCSHSSLAHIHAESGHWAVHAFVCMFPVDIPWTVVVGNQSAVVGDNPWAVVVDIPGVGVMAAADRGS
jgi:hypothetical protein